MNIEPLIKKSLEELLRIYEEKKHESYLIFPETRKLKKKRISEQESVFLLARELEMAKKLYSIEAPTRKAYDFKKDPKESEKGSSGSIDMCVYADKNPSKREHLIEFKAHSPKQKMFDKDFLKLKIDDPDTKINYFVHILYQCEKNTLQNVINKYKKSLEYIHNHPFGSTLKICICLLGNFPTDRISQRIFFFDEANIIDKFTKITEEIYSK